MKIIKNVIKIIFFNIKNIFISELRTIDNQNNTFDLVTTNMKNNNILDI